MCCFKPLENKFLKIVNFQVLTSKILRFTQAQHTFSVKMV